MGLRDTVRLWFRDLRLRDWRLSDTVVPFAPESAAQMCTSGPFRLRVLSLNIWVSATASLRVSIRLRACSNETCHCDGRAFRWRIWRAALARWLTASPRARTDGTWSASRRPGLSPSATDYAPPAENAASSTRTVRLKA